MARSVHVSGDFFNADQEADRYSILRHHAQRSLSEPPQIPRRRDSGRRGRDDGRRSARAGFTFNCGRGQCNVTNYNNYYEFSTDKYGPAGLAKDFKTRPWTVTIDGLVKEKQVLDVDSIIKMAAPEERIYRHRCVEGWSIVVPWVGFSLNELIKKAEALGKAKFVQFTTIHDPKQMPGQKGPVLEWPYVEGLRMDEAMHPLALLCFGMYGEVLPNQDGAPLRIVVPWKYGFKSAKAIVKVSFKEEQPTNTWNLAAPNEYGFYSNVNPNVDHPRWSQAKERRLGEFFKRPTQMFNGYGDQVASLYNGMDLRKNF